MKKILIATIAAVAMTGAASAADMSVPLKARAAPTPVYNWTGCYVDAGGGYGVWNQSHYAETTATGFPLTGEQTTGGRGYYGEVGGGCDYQFSVGGLGNFVVGVLGGYDFSSLKGAYTDTFWGNANSYEKQTSLGFAGGRIGYLVTPNLLTYMSAGWTDTRFNAVSLTSPAGVVIGANFGSHTYNGWFLGGGAETSLSPWLPTGFFLRSDYRFSTFQQADISYVSNAGVATGVSTHMNKYDQQIGTELVYRFNYH